MYNEFKSPFFSPEENLEMAIGTVEFKDEVIKNLRQQIAVLRNLAEEKYSKEFIDNIQYAHQRLDKI